MHAEQQDQLKEDLAEVIANHKYMDISLPVVNMTYEAESLGISSCILSLAVKEANSILKVPEGCDAILAVGLGYEKKGAFQRARQRKELPEFVFHERYGKKK
jgi:nitroreductase